MSCHCEDCRGERIDRFVMSVILLVLLAALVSGFLRPAVPNVVSSARREARARIERCASGFVGEKRLAELDKVVWKDLPDSDSDSVLRARTALPDTIYVHPAWSADEWTIAHEMLHVAVGRPGHPQFPFATCGLQRPDNP